MSLELNCLVLGDDPSHVFLVKIADSESIGSLKKAIREEKKHAFQDVDADSLKLFRVSFPVNDDLDATLTHFQREHDAASVRYLSRPVTRLKGLFSDHEPEHIHVIVQSPPAGKYQSYSLY